MLLVGARRALIKRPALVAAGGSVVLDIVGTEGLSGTPVSTYDFTGGSVGAGLTNGALVAVVVAVDGNTNTGMSAVWDNGGTNQTMTLIGSVAHPIITTMKVYIFGRRNPTAGNNLTLRLSWTGGSQVAVDTVSWSGVDQTSDGVAFPNFTSATGTAASGTTSVTITNTSGSMVMAGHANDAAVFSSLNETPIYNESGGAAYVGGANRSASVTPAMTATFSGTANWVSAGCSIKAA